MDREEAIKKLIIFAKEAYESYGDELEMNLLERAVGDEFQNEMKTYEEGKEELFELIRAIAEE